MTSSPRSLIVTGIDGFVGRHIAAIAHAAGTSVHGVGLTPELEPVVAASVATYVSADLTSGWPDLPEADAIIHLAGLAAVGPSFDQPQRYIEVNSSMVTTMCEHLLAKDYRGTLVMVSSGAVYAASAEPITEDFPIEAASPYAVSKLLVESQMEYYRRRGLRTVVARPFNHIGPGQRPGFLVPDLFARLAALEPGAPLPVGDLSTRRDYLDARDVARAYLALAQADAWAHPVYNVASGTPRSGEEMLTLLCGATGCEIPPLVTDPALVRPTDGDTVTGDATRLREDLGWAPRYTIEDSLRDFVAAA